jgi:hypothetical protein
MMTEPFFLGSKKGRALMPAGMIFWMLMILWFLFGLYWNWPAANQPGGFGVLGGNLLLFVLLFILGWKLFGFVIQ